MILFYGDSNTYGYDPADWRDHRYPEEKRWTSILAGMIGDKTEVVCEGMNGRRLPDLRYDSERIRKLAAKCSSKQDIFAVMLGTNDILSSMEPDAGPAVRRMDLLLDFLTTQLDPEQILVIAPVPVGSPKAPDRLLRHFYAESLRMNREFERLALQYQTRFADAGRWGVGLSFDMVHFSEEGHRQFADAMANFLFE